MRKLIVFLFVMVLVFALGGMAKAEVILFEDFEDSSGFTLAGCVPLYWGTAPLSGTASIPSQFLQGSSSQSGMIFYGSGAKEHSLSPAATMTIVLPCGFTNLELTVALAAAMPSMWEPSHRDSLHIIGGTTISPPYVDCSSGHGCMPVAGAIDSFLPLSYPDDLRSNVYSIPLGHQFQDFNYAIDSSLRSLTFAFASTAAVEVIGIDSVRITGDPLSELPVALDIKPGSCPNPINVKSKGVLPTAIVGTSCFDVTQVDPASVLLEGVAPLRWAYVDTTSPFEPLLCKKDCNEDCDELCPDGLLDLAINFDMQEIVASLGEVSDGECLVLTLTGNLKEEFGSIEIIGEDVMLILKKGNQ